MLHVFELLSETNMPEPSLRVLPAETLVDGLPRARRLSDVKVWHEGRFFDIYLKINVLLELRRFAIPG